MATEKEKSGFMAFGSEIAQWFSKQKDANKEPERELISPVPKDEEESDVTTVGAGGHIGHYYDIGGIDSTAQSEVDLIYKYRGAAQHAEVDAAISDIVNEAIASPEMGPPVKLIIATAESGFSAAIIEKVYDEFDKVLSLLDFAKSGYDIFRRWYIDGRLYYHIVVDRDKPGDGIFEARLIDPTRLKRVKEVKESFDKRTGVKISETVEEFFMYQNTDLINTTAVTATGVKIAKDAIIEVNSGILDSKRRLRLSHLHKALKVVNQLRTMEDSLVIYRIARAPERRIFYVDTGNLPRGKAEEYFRQIMSKYRNKITYDVQTGEIKDSRRHMSMLEDFWIPRREGSNSTEISTLPGGDNLGSIDDIIYFKNNLYRSLNVPQTRLDPDAGFNGGSGRATEITRDEVKFQKFINRLRSKFAFLFINMLKQQVRLKSIMTETEWKKFEQHLIIDFIQDNHFYQAKEFEVLQDKLTILRDIQDYVGKYFSEEWVFKNVLFLTDDEIKERKAQMKKEAAAAPTDGDDAGDKGW